MLWYFTSLREDGYRCGFLLTIQLFKVSENFTFLNYFFKM